MKNRFPNQRRAGGLLVLAAVMLGAGCTAHAQLNEDKIERDATGVYTGTSGGGRYSYNYIDPIFSDPAPTTIPTERGRVRVPVKDGKLSSSLNDPDLPGTGKAACSGTEQRSTVLRGGKLIAVKAKGKVVLDDGPSHAPWTGATITGKLTDKGAKWNAQTKGDARQVNVNAPTPNIKTVSGNDFKGNG
jgi:hypothetical protein